MYQSNYGYYNQQPQLRQAIAPQVPQIPVLKGHPVASLEEARASTIDFDGSVFFFPDLANKKIYTKQINTDGTASLNMYVQEAIPVAPAPGGNYVTHEELETIIGQLRQSLVQTAKEAVPQEQPSKPAIKF